MQIFDEDSANDVAADNRTYEAWQIRERNRILRIGDSKRKQAEWNKLYPKIALEGLSEKDLEVSDGVVW